MATTADTRPTKSDAAVERGIATAAAKVRANDLVTGVTALAVLVLGYVAVTMVLDKWLTLPDWVRQLGVGGLLAGVAGVGYLFVVRPLRRQVNPRYIARQVERTLPDAKNVLINWVDLTDRDLPGSVKSAVAAKAADGLADADVDAATQPKTLVWLGATAGALVIVLAALFLVFKWSQFASLVGRAVNPFAGTAIATRTHIELLDPAEGNTTVTDGEQLNVAVRIAGRVPDPAGDEKPRLLVRHNPEATGYDEFPLARGESSRDYSLMVPRSVIQNGFWYKVAAGDAETPEYRVAVRTRPMLTAFRADYDYPAYLKWPADTSADAKLKAYRGTTVTLTVKANRELTAGDLTAVTPAGSDVVRGDVTGEKKDSLRFKLKLDQSGTYTVRFKPAGTEPTAASPEYPIEVQTDQPPSVTITAPKEEELTLPATGLLAVDATLTDDFGLASAALRLKVVGRDGVVIPGKRYRDGKPFLRAKDGTHETYVTDYKDSVKLDALKDDKGQPVTLKDGDVLEYWVEATDTCTEPAANVGESAHKKVRIAPPPPKPDPKQLEDQQKKDQQRKADEQNAAQKQDDRQKNDTRPPDQGRNPDPDKQPQQPKPDPDQPQDPTQGGDPMGGQQGDPNPKGQKKDGDPTKGGTGAADPSKGDPGKQDSTPAGNDPKADPPKPDPKADDPMKGGTDQNDQNQKTDPNQKQDPTQKADPNQKSPDKTEGGKGGAAANDQDVQRKADELKEKLDKQNAEPGGAKGDGNSVPKDQQTKPDAAAKPPEGGNKAGDPPPAEQKGGEPGKPGEQPPAEGKDGGTMAQPDRTQEKPAPKDGAKGADQPRTDTPKPTPEDQQGAAASKDSKPEPGSGSGSQTAPKSDPMGGPKGDAQKDGPAGSAKPADPKAGEKTGDPGDKPDQPASGSKPKADPERATAKPQDQPGKPDGTPEPKAGGAKGDQPTEPAAKKGAQPEKSDAGKPNEENGPPPDAGAEKGPPKPDAADPTGKKVEPGEAKGEGTKPAPMKPQAGTGDGADEKSASKPPMPDQTGKGGAQPESKPAGPGGQTTGEKTTQPDQKQPGGAGTDEKMSRKEIEDAIRELDSENPGSRARAQQKLDQAMGKKNRETVERLNRDAKSGDPQKQEQAKKDLDELAKKSSNPQPPNEPTEQEKKDLADAAKNLNSPNDAERKAAEQKLDDALGKKKREELQQDLKDLAGNDPEKARKAKEKLEQAARDAKAQAQGDGRDPADRLGGSGFDQAGKPIAADLENQLKTRERQLREFKDVRGKKEFLRDSNMTEEEFDKFLKSYEELVDRTRDEVDRAKLNPTDPAAPGKPGIRNDAGGDRVTGRGPAGGTVPGAGGASVAPPGFSEAQKRFAQEAAKRGGQK